MSNLWMIMGIQDHDTVDDFHLIVVPKLRTQIAELQTQQGVDCQELKKALKEEYFLEDSQRITKQSFMKWIYQKNKSLSARELLQEFEKTYDQLFITEQQSIRSKWVKLFVEAETSEDEIKDKPATFEHKLEEPRLDDLIKGIQELNLNLKAVKLEGLSSKGSTSYLRQRPLHRGCMWCDTFNKADDDDSRAYGDLWLYALKTAKKGKVSWGNCAKQRNASVRLQEKQKQDEESVGSSKRATRSSNKKGPPYKLKSNIELATDLKKVFKERILNSKVKMAVGDILGIAKREFHEEIIDIIKRK
ncbi:hypothetical protein L7F22_055321 [Adiantum nelumboides]|nr:hypothetical protein [Adiantum nelumboides]